MDEKTKRYIKDMICHYYEYAADAEADYRAAFADCLIYAISAALDADGPELE